MDSVYIITHHAAFLLTNYADIQRKSKSNMSKIVQWPSCKNHFLFQAWHIDDIRGGYSGALHHSFLLRSEEKKLAKLMRSSSQFDQMSSMTGIQSFIHKLEAIRVSGHLP